MERVVEEDLVEDILLVGLISVRKELGCVSEQV